MSEMVERVARALYECPGSDAIAKTGDAFPIPDWSDAHPAVKDDCRVKARAAIAAMREPTEAMQDSWAREVYQELIDAAIRGSPTR